MNQWIQHFRWDFPGGAWGIAVALAAGLLLIALSYRYTLRKTSANAKVALTMLRFTFMLFIIFCLCRPRIERERSMKSSSKKKVAVLVDDSGSMRIKGFWKKDRLQEAMTFWREKVKKGDDTYKYEYFSFAEKLNQCLDFNSRPKQNKIKDLNTKLYKIISESCNRFPAENFDGVIYMTDGIDTSGVSPQDAVNKLAASNLKHIFVPICTELPSKSYITLRKVEAANRAFVGTEVPVLIMTQQSNISPTTKIELKVTKNGGKPVAIHKLRSGSGVQSIKFRLPIRKAGVALYIAVLSLDGKAKAEVAWSITKSLKKESARILIYQGALDWGTRFLRYVFADNDKIKLELRYASKVYDINQRNASTNFPDSTELTKYDVVVLFNLNRKQINSRMERDLRDFVSRGGGLFFLNGNPVSVKEFADSPLEKLLPVKFDPNYNKAIRSDAQTMDFLRKINSTRSRTRWDTRFRQNKEFTFKVPELKKFKLSRIGQQSPIFKRKTKLGKIKQIIPKFQDIAWVQEAKPGANVLAYWHDKRKAKKRILLAYQNFGKGRSMVLATDPLWRWRMNTSSKDKSFEKFWQNLFFWLAQGQNEEARWIIPNLLISGGKQIEISFVPGKNMIDINKIKCHLENRKTIQKLFLSPTVSKGRYFVKFASKPNQKYTLKAQYEGKVIASVSFLTQPQEKSKIEEVILKPDLKILHEFATLPNVYIEDSQDGFDIRKYFTTKTFILSEKESFPLWHRWWIYLIIVGFFAAEMIIRRFFKLV